MLSFKNYDFGFDFNFQLKLHIGSYPKLGLIVLLGSIHIGGNSFM